MGKNAGKYAKKYEWTKDFLKSHPQKELMKGMPGGSRSPGAMGRMAAWTRDFSHLATERPIHLATFIDSCAIGVYMTLSQ